jgi:hypothetical protein
MKPGKILEWLMESDEETSFWPVIILIIVGVYVYLVLM